MSRLRLGVNVDHVATLRQARYATMPESRNAEPDPVMAASICERAGASGIVAHLRSDRRHILDRDIERLRQNIMTKLNLEMGNTEEIVDIALRIRPEEVCLVPEKREEVTTEGGLDVIAHRKELDQAPFYFFQVVMIPIKNLLRFVEIKIVFGQLRPRQFRDRLDVANDN